ncbi:MAG: hypothetical protein RSB04_07830 [Gordonibacter sp.]|uniref:hypothetical protein n=1 Tax=Gordonibacter sp. TaxID=1968902 RepID=UPI002FC9E96C
MSNHTLDVTEPIIIKDESGTPLVLGDYVLDASGLRWLVCAYAVKLLVGLEEVGIHATLVKDGIPGNTMCDFFTHQGHLLGYTKES